MRDMISTGIVWCPSIPSDWEIRRVKNCFYISKVKAGTKNPVVLKLARSGVQVKDVTVNGGQMAESYDDYNPVQVGDLLLNPMDLYSGANCNVSEVEGVISPAYVNLRAKESINPYFFDYYFKIQYWTMAMFAHGKGVSYDNRWTINAESVKAYELPFPSVDEQDLIVDSIKKRSIQIDALITNAEQQIEKLKAYKQSVITETVTKGLDPDVAMKDSGVEWIGEIPENWEVIRLKNLATIVRGGSPRPAGDERFYVGSIPFMKIADITKDENKYVYDCVSSIKEAGLVHTRMVEPETLLLTNSGATLGVPKITMFRTTFNDGIAAFLNIDKKIDILYAFYSLKARTKLFLESASMGMGQPNLNTEIIGNTLITLPSIEEQNEIVAYLDEKCSQIDKLIALKQQKIEKLQQYKKSLIYEYVTGKKEV